MKDIRSKLIDYLSKNLSDSFVITDLEKYSL